jgi:hypothetical protein
MKGTLVSAAESDLVHKIPDHKLRQFALEGDAEDERPVLIELASEPVNRDWFQPWSIRRDDSPKRESSSQKDKLDMRRARMNDLAELLSDSGLKEAVKIGVADAFVVRANPIQLRRLVESPLVGTVRLNRTHGKRAAH